MVTLSDAAVRALNPLQEGYADLAARVLAVAEQDPHVLALSIAGSVGRGVADAGSDLDLVVTVDDGSFDEWTPSSLALWESAIDPVISLAIPGATGIFAFTARSGLRCDIVTERLSEVPQTPYTHRIALLDRGEVAAQLPAPGETDEQPDAARAEGIVREVLRQTVIFPAAVVARADWLLGQEAVHNVRLALYQLLVESNRPLPAMGVKQWSSKLNQPQRDLMASLAPPAATRDSVTEAMVAVRAAFRRDGRAAYERIGGVWPSELDDATAAYWSRHGLPD